MSEEMKTCPSCACAYGYDNGNGMYACPECGNEWKAIEEEVEEIVSGLIVKDANGNILVDGDSVVVIKDLPVKGNLRSIKSGTKVKNIRLKDGDHNIDCKIDGFGAMALKSEFVRKG